MWLALVQGIGYGFAAGTQPGPLQTYLITQAIAKGWRQSLPAAFAPLVSDGPIIALCLFVLNRIPLQFQNFLYLAGGGFVLYLAYGTYISWKNFESIAPAEEQANHQSLFKAALVNILSPGAYIFWSLVTGPILLASWRTTPLYGIAFLVGFYVTFLVCLMLTVFIFSTMQNIGQKVRRAVLGISAVVLFGFGIMQVWLGLR
jgi:threonine/homoserine/homoserine lactone efflux protein